MLCMYGYLTRVWGLDIIKQLNRHNSHHFSPCLVMCLFLFQNKCITVSIHILLLSFVIHILPWYADKFKKRLPKVNQTFITCERVFTRRWKTLVISLSVDLSCYHEIDLSCPILFHPHEFINYRINAPFSASTECLAYTWLFISFWGTRNSECGCPGDQSNQRSLNARKRESIKTGRWKKFSQSKFLFVCHSLSTSSSDIDLNICSQEL